MSEPKFAPFYWMAFDPGLSVIPWASDYWRTGAIKAVEEWTGLKWKELKKQGWIVRKVEVRLYEEGK